MKFKIKFPSFGKKEVKKEEKDSLSYSDQSPSRFDGVNLQGLFMGLVFVSMTIFIGSMVLREINKSIVPMLNSTTSSANSSIGTAVPQLANALSFITPIFWVAILLVPAYWIWRIFSSTGDVGL